MRVKWVWIHPTKEAQTDLGNYIVDGEIHEAFDIHKPITEWLNNTSVDEVFKEGWSVCWIEE